MYVGIPLHDYVRVVWVECSFSRGVVPIRARRRGSRTGWLFSHIVRERGRSVHWSLLRRGPALLAAKHAVFLFRTGLEALQRAQAVRKEGMQACRYAGM